HESRVYATRSDWKSKSHEETIGWSDTESDRMLCLYRRSAVTDGSHVVEQVEVKIDGDVIAAVSRSNVDSAEAILHGCVYDTIPAKRRDIKLVPTPKCRRVA